MDWGKFSFDWRYESAQLRHALVEIEAIKLALPKLALPADWKLALDRLNRVRAIHGTTAIEGNPLSEEQTRLVLDSPSPGVGDTKEQRQVRNAGEAQAWVRQRCAPGRPPFKLEDIQHVHELITRGSDEHNNTPGRFRNFEVTCGTEALGGVHRGAPARDVPALMQALVEFLSSPRLQAEPPPVQALLAHFFLVTIHPFGDGNGRVSRLVEAGILYRGGYNEHGFYGLSNFFYKNEREYKTLLQRSRAVQPFEVTPFLSFGLRGLATEFVGILAFVQIRTNRLFYREAMRRAAEMRISKNRRGLNQRELAFLDFLLSETEPSDPFGEPARISLDQVLAAPFVRHAYGNVSHRTLLRELVRLQQAGFLRYEPEGKATMIGIDFNAIGKY